MSFKSTAIEFTISHLPTVQQVPHIAVRSITVDPANKPIPTETWLWASAALPVIPDTDENKKLVNLIWLATNNFYDITSKQAVLWKQKTWLDFFKDNHQCNQWWWCFGFKCNLFFLQLKITKIKWLQYSITAWFVIIW